MSDIPAIQVVIASAIGDRLEGAFKEELDRWSEKSGIEMMGTEAIEAYFLTRIAQTTIKELTEAEIASRLAEMVR